MFLEIGKTHSIQKEAKIMANLKKEFQKVIGEIRRFRGGSDYPKAMCTNQQMCNNTATVNCGGERNAEKSAEIAREVLKDKKFSAFIAYFKAEAKVEYVGRNGGVQIRVNFQDENAETKEEETMAKKAVEKEEKGMKKAMFTLDGVGYNQNAKGNRFFKIDADGNTVRIARSEYEIAYETYMDNAEQEMYDEEQETRAKKGRESDKIAEDSVNRPKKAKRTRATTSVVDLGKIKVALTEKQIAFMMALPLSKDWKNVDSEIHIMDLGMDLGGEFAEKPMTVGAMITTLREKGIIFVTKGSRKERSFNLTDVGVKVAIEMGLK